jgi:hypothetical protein
MSALQHGVERLSTGRRNRWKPKSGRSGMEGLFNNAKPVPILQDLELAPEFKRTRSVGAARRGSQRDQLGYHYTELFDRALDNSASS